MVPGSILIYSFPETSRQEMKHEIKKKKKDHMKTKNKMSSRIMFFFFMLMLKFKVHVFQSHSNMTKGLKKCPREKKKPKNKKRTAIHQIKL